MTSKDYDASALALIVGCLVLILYLALAAWYEFQHQPYSTRYVYDTSELSRKERTSDCVTGKYLFAQELELPYLLSFYYWGYGSYIECGSNTEKAHIPGR